MFKSKILTTDEIRTFVDYINAKKEIDVVVYKEVAGFDRSGKKSQTINRIMSIAFNNGYLDRIESGVYSLIKKLPYTLGAGRISSKKHTSNPYIVQ